MSFQVLITVKLCRLSLSLVSSVTDRRQKIRPPVKSGGGCCNDNGPAGPRKDAFLPRLQLCTGVVLALILRLVDKHALMRCSDQYCRHKEQLV